MKGCFVSRIQPASCLYARKSSENRKDWKLLLHFGYSIYRFLVSLRPKVAYQKEEGVASRWSTTEKLVVTLLRTKRRKKCMIFMSRVEAR